MKKRLYLFISEYLHITLVLLLVLGTYLPNFQAEFVNWDDGEYVTDNPDMLQHNWKGLATKPMQGNYHPLTMLSLGLNYLISGKDAWSYHAFNILLHLLNTLLCYLFVLKLTDRRRLIALLVACWFGIHPMHVESVAWVTERKDVLYASFFLAGLVTYMDYLKNNSPKFLIYTFLLFILSLASKPAAVVFPLTLVCVDFYFGREKQLRAYLEKIPFLLGAMLMGYLTYSAQKHTGALVDTSIISRYNSFFFGFYGIMMYAWYLFFPLKLSTFHPFPDSLDDKLPDTFLFSPVFTLVLLLFTFVSLRWTRLFAFGVGFYLVNLLLVLQFLSIGSAVIAERYTYMPYVGLFFIVAYGLEVALEKWQIAGKILLAAACGLSLWWTSLTLKQVRTWDNSLKIWTNAIEVEPNARVFLNRGLVYAASGEKAKAIGDYTMSARMCDYDYETFAYRGNAYFDLGMDSLAEADYLRSLELKSDDSPTLDNYGALLTRQKRYDEALEKFEQAIGYQPDYAAAYYNRGVAHLEMGCYDEAIPDFLRYMELLGSEDPDVYNSIAICYQYLDEDETALEWFDKAYKLRPNPIFLDNKQISVDKLKDKSP